MGKKILVLARTKLWLESRDREVSNKKNLMLESPW